MRALRNEAPFGPLHVRHLCASPHNEDEAAVDAFAADVAAHASLTRLTLFNGPQHATAALNAVVDAALVRSMETVALQYCRLFPASSPALARLLSSGTLTTLQLSGWTDEQLLDAPAAAVLAAALRANVTLTSLSLDKRVDVFADLTAGAELLGALTGHASLRVLWLTNNVLRNADPTAVGASLGALVDANASVLPSWTRRHVSWAKTACARCSRRCRPTRICAR